MPNFFTDNEDIRFLFRHIDLASLAEMCEEGFKFAKEFDSAPADGEEAVRNYEMVLNEIGRLSAEFIAPRAEGIDLEGNILNEDGSVTYATGMREALDKLAKAEVMGFTLPHRFGGLNFPNLIYSIAIEIVSRADASLMNIFGLQGIAETIDAFASEDIRKRYLPQFADGKVTGAMVLTEPDAGSDLQAVKLRAFQDEDGRWFLHGVKRFITNGCGEVLLVLARSEPERSGGLGLSLFICERGPSVKIRRLENKLGIHGSPTCEIFFDNTPCELIGERQRGLVTYVMSLMNGARIGVAGQGLGIAEAAYRVARDYGASRKQFGVAIEKLPAVRDMLTDMKIAVEAGRALLYETSRIVDIEIVLEKRLEYNPPKDKDEKKELKQESKTVKRIAGMLTPMSKYFCSEMANRVCYDAIQVLGGSGYMKDYPVERHARDARITSIYEGTSQLQIVAAVRGVCNGTAERYMKQLAEAEYDAGVSDLLDILAEGREQLAEAVTFVKEQGTEYMDLYGKDLVDIAIELINGYLFCHQASTKVDMQIPASGEGAQPADRTVSMKDRKTKIAKRFVKRNAPRIAARVRTVCMGDKSTFEDYPEFIQPLPAE
jgi:alkylation response protein AidB-like acyl-CoA dehydrogenase